MDDWRTDMSSNVVERAVFGIAELSERWRVSHFTVRRAINSGALRSITIGTRRLVPVEEVERVEREGLVTSRNAVRETVAKVTSKAQE